MHLLIGLAGIDSNYICYFLFGGYPICIVSYWNHIHYVFFLAVILEKSSQHHPDSNSGPLACHPGMLTLCYCDLPDRIGEFQGSNTSKSRLIEKNWANRIPQNGKFFCCIMRCCSCYFPTLRFQTSEFMLMAKSKPSLGECWRNPSLATYIFW